MAASSWPELTKTVGRVAAIPKHGALCGEAASRDAQREIRRLVRAQQRRVDARQAELRRAVIHQDHGGEGLQDQAARYRLLIQVQVLAAAQVDGQGRLGWVVEDLPRGRLRRRAG